MLIIFVILVSNNPALCFWPPPYKVDLNYEQTFVIDEHLEKKDVQDVYDEDELLKKEDMRSLNIEPEDDKYFRIDQEIKKSDKNTKEQRLSDEDNFKKHKVYEEENPDIEELVPWQAGFVDKSGEINNSREMIYFDEEARQKINKTKREKSPTKDDYDYSQFKAEYSKNVEMEQKSNNTANYTEVKEEESFKDAVKTLVKNAPGNCSEQENKGIGISALGCIIIDLQKPKMRSRSLEKFIRIVIIWTVVYLVIAVPLWCQYGDNQRNPTNPWQARNNQENVQRQPLSGIGQSSTTPWPTLNQRKNALQNAHQQNNQQSNLQSNVREPMWIRPANSQNWVRNTPIPNNLAAGATQKPITPSHTKITPLPTSKKDTIVQFSPNVATNNNRRENDYSVRLPNNAAVPNTNTQNLNTNNNRNVNNSTNVPNNAAALNTNTQYSNTNDNRNVHNSPTRFPNKPVKPNTNTQNFNMDFINNERGTSNKFNTRTEKPNPFLGLVAVQNKNDQNVGLRQDVLNQNRPSNQHQQANINRTPLPPLSGNAAAKNTIQSVSPGNLSNKKEEVSPQPQNAEDDELREFAEELLKKDTNNAAKYVTINVQGMTSSRSTRDEAPELLLKIQPEAYSVPSISKLMQLYNNYILESAENEVYTGQEKLEENELLDTILSSGVMQHTRNFLISKGKIGKDPKEFKDLLRLIWFNMYSRGGGRIGSSGFEHVFLAEIKNNQVSGLHNWVYFHEEEKQNNANYLGYMKKLDLGNKGAILKYHFVFQNVDKPVGGMFVGTSPEFEIALYSTCFILRADKICPVKLNGNKFIIRTYTYRYRGKNMIGSAFPEI